LDCVDFVVTAQLASQCKHGLAADEPTSAGDEDAFHVARCLWPVVQVLLHIVVALIARLLLKSAEYVRPAWVHAPRAGGTVLRKESFT
jgi:hypothetical protein